MLLFLGISLIFIVSNCFVQAVQDTAHTRKDPHFTKESFSPDITSIKYLDTDEQRQILSVLANHFPTLYLSSGVSELSNDLNALLGSIDGKSKLILRISLSTVQEMIILLGNIESVIKNYNLGHHCEAIIFLVGEELFYVFGYKYVRSKVKTLEIGIKTGISLKWVDNPLRRATLPEKIDVLELPTESVDSFVTYSLFEDYIDSLLEPYNFLEKERQESPVFILKSELQLRKDLFQDNQTITRYLCLQAEMMSQISHMRNIHFIIDIADEIKISNGITFFANRTSQQTTCIQPKNLENNVIYNVFGIAPYRWVRDPPTLHELIVISELFRSTYNSGSLILEKIESYKEALILKRIHQNSSVNLGIYMPIKDPEDSEFLDSFLMGLAEHPPISISTIHIHLAGIIFHLHYQHSKEQTGSGNKKESLSKVATEFKEKFTKINVTLVAICDRQDVVNAIVDYPIRKNSTKRAAYAREAFLISDMVLWHDAIQKHSGTETFHIYQSITIRLTSSTVLYHLFKNIYANVELIFGIRSFYLHSTEAEPCRPEMLLRNDEFLQILYHWAGIYGLKIAETMPFSLFTDTELQHGRWTVVPQSQLGVNGSIRITSEAPCEKWDPAGIEKSKYIRNNSTGISINFSSFRELSSTSKTQLLQIALARFQTIELVFSAEINITVENPCPAKGNGPSTLQDIEHLLKTKKYRSIFVSLEQDDNLFATINCLKKQIKQKTSMEH